MIKFIQKGLVVKKNVAYVYVCVSASVYEDAHSQSAAVSFFCFLPTDNFSLYLAPFL